MEAAFINLTPNKLPGQLYEIAEDIFSLKLKVSVVKESTEGSYNVAVLRLEFDNSNYVSCYHIIFLFSLSTYIFLSFYSLYKSSKKHA